MSAFSKIFPLFLKRYIQEKSGVPDMFLSLKRLKRLGFDPQCIVDIGAYEGEWTKECLKIFPYANYLMVEAILQKQSRLNAIVSKYSNVKYELSLVGAQEGEEVSFTELETASSVLDEVIVKHNRVKRKMRRLDGIVKEQEINKVDLIKLDVQGYELEVLKGFGEFLQNTDIIIMECSLIDIHKNSPLVREVLNFMFDYGFVVYDICSVSTRRPLDKALWQTDLIFVKENSRFRSDKRYSE